MMHVMYTLSPSYMEPPDGYVAGTMSIRMRVIHLRMHLIMLRAQMMMTIRSNVPPKLTKMVSMSPLEIGGNLTRPTAFISIHMMLVRHGCCLQPPKQGERDCQRETRET